MTAGQLCLVIHRRRATRISRQWAPGSLHLFDRRACWRVFWRRFLIPVKASKRFEVTRSSYLEERIEADGLPIAS
jgi:hypothetical protein